ncbi:dnapol [Leucania separata nucleopolyhedrovirus]|uniref:DNA-directed DNA polymerase n=1 Tax=Leucania separata nucleopolyhedrovirus TaxID=1307956 RepID=Q0IL35_NPVLS|nr:dnapol [Leucania separata nucleopolyhedrovirus]AAR28848.1 dnapol [Leucania separata nucleopolyhedrovirus]
MYFSTDTLVFQLLPNLYYQTPPLLRATMEREVVDNESIRLRTFDDLKADLAKDCVRSARIVPTDVFRITRMYYRYGRLYIFMTGHVQSKPDRVFQFYHCSPCTLHSYKKCYNYHANERCRDDCRSYKTFVMPGLRDVYYDKVNVVKYTRPTVAPPANGRKQYDCVDYFLKDINRVHMQMGLIEGSYVRFASEQTVLDNGIRDGTYKDLIVVDPETLEREINPVLACFDLETHTDCRRMSNPRVDFIISISLVVKRDNRYKKICLYYINRDTAVDLRFENDDNDAAADNETIAVPFTHEGAMLTAFFELFSLLNFDYLLDYNGDSFDWPFLLMRSELYTSGAYDFTKIARYDLEPVAIETEQLWDKFQNKIDTHHLAYYIHVDLYQFLSNDPEQGDVENFQLNTVAQHYLNASKIDLKISRMIELYRAKRMRDIIAYNVRDSLLPIELFVKLETMEFIYTQCMVMMLCTDDVLKNISHKVTTKMFHNALTNTRRMDGGGGEPMPDPFFFDKSDLNVTSGRKSASNDRQLVDLTLLNRRPIPAAMIPPDVVRLCADRERCVYKGGKVLSPIPGMYKSVVTLDFNSLYLNIMKNEGICLSNVFLATDRNVYLHKNLDAVNPKLLEELLDLRTKYKNLRDKYDPSSFKYSINDKVQNSVKRIANSIYGYFGIFFKPLANYVTKIGRDKLSDAIRKIEAMSNDATILERFNLSSIKFKVIYGDTDSSFILVDYREDEIEPDRRNDTINAIINEHVLKTVNGSWNGYKMALENVMISLILLKKKKYCYLNTNGRIKYKGWLVKKDMPIFMRKSFRNCVDMLLRRHSLGCALDNLRREMFDHYERFSVNNLADYCFSMTYNENPSGNKRDGPSEPKRQRVISIAKHCVELLKSSGADFIPGNGDRVPYLLRDVEGNVTAKSYPVQTFDPQKMTVSWVKHMNILCTFMNELIQVFGNRDEFAHCFESICQLYMSKMTHDVKHPVLRDMTASLLREKTKKAATRKDADSCDEDEHNDNDEDDDDENCQINYTHQFSMYKRKPKVKSTNSVPDINCSVCAAAN